VGYDAIWRALERERGLRATPELTSRLTPAETTVLTRCGGCGLEYFAPSVPGDAEFYERLAEGAYYELDRWEFGVVAALTGDDEDVLDVGCGRGDFLAQIADRAGRSVGLDHNRDAIQALSDRGIDGVAMDLGDFARTEPGRFDTVCAFQILEHVPSAGALIEPAIASLRPGGRLFVSVPNRRRASRPELEPFDHPPHHVSRWSAEQFESLADLFGLELTAMRFEQPDFSTVEELDFARVQRAGGRLLARAHRRLVSTPARHARVAKREGYTKRGLFGHTMLAELRLRG
jgi:SAM-dependent methyltransferase